MLINLFALAMVGFAAYHLATKLVIPKLDSPANNSLVKGLEKSELKAAVKENETKLKECKEEVKKLEQERQAILKSEDTDKADKAQEKLEAKEEKIKELTETEQNLADLKVVASSSWKAKLPNKLTLNNGLWIGGFCLALVLIYKLVVGIFRSVFRNTSLEE